MSNTIKSIVREIHRGEAIVIVDNKKLRISIPKSFLNNHKTERNFLSVGDMILLSYDKKSKKYILNKRLDRKNFISRKDPFLNHISHIIASNIDYLGIVVSIKDPEISFELIDRYLITASKNNIEAFVIINKIDLLDDNFLKNLDLKFYNNLNINVILCSVKEEKSIDEIKDFIKDKIVLFSGPSGVGKSSILNLLEPEKIQKTSSVSSKDQRGRHTTRASKLIALKSRGYIIDSPGIQDFTLDNIDFFDLKTHYIDFYPYYNECKFKNCTHKHEKICGVKNAVNEGKIPKIRYDNYLSILNEL